MQPNLDPETVKGFGEEWAHFDQSGASDAELDGLFARYFSIFPWEDLPRGAVGFDLGCGSGRWAQRVAPRVASLHCVDASEAALAVARRNLARHMNCVFHLASVGALPIPRASMDFGYSLGVLHHVPDTEAGIRACVEALKPGAPFLLYLYYSLDNRPTWYRVLWKISDLGRCVLSRSPRLVRFAFAYVIAVCVYCPLVWLGRALECMFGEVRNLPLNFYRNASLYTMATDALDRFGTRLEQRFSRQQIQEMMARSGLEGIRFSEEMPFWVAIGIRKGVRP